MTDLAAQLAAVQRAYREGIRPVLGVRWRPGRSHEGNVWAQTGSRDDWKDDYPLLSAKTGDLAAEVCESHNAMLDLLWLTEAGFNVEFIRRQASWRVSLSPAPDGWTAACGQGASIGDALAKAREWAGRREGAS